MGNVVGDSTSVNVFKALVGAVRLADEGRDEILVDATTFPTDGYIAESAARLTGCTLRALAPAEIPDAVGAGTAAVLLNHVDYRTGRLHDLPSLTSAIHAAGALAVWDLCHSAGALPVGLDAHGVDLAVGCTYKYLNGGPGAPAFVYVAERLLDEVAQPVQGWMGATDPFLMGPHYRPAAGVRRMLSGTPPVIGMLAMQDMLGLLEKAGMGAVRAKSVALTEHAIALADERLPGVSVASPRETSRRGGHVTLNHPAMREVTAALWSQDVIPDYRDPHGLRLGLSPLSTSFAEVESGLASVRRTLEQLAG